MRNYYTYFAVFLILTCFSCKKDSNTNNNSSQNNSSQNNYPLWTPTGWSVLGTYNANYVFNNNVSFGAINSIYSDASGNIYAGGYGVAKWNGTNWTELGNLNNSNGGYNIQTICVDAIGNVYAAGYLTDNNGKYYVAKWNGSAWSELGHDSTALNSGYSISSICADTAGNIYAAGTFTNSSGNYYVAKWNGINWSQIGIGTNTLNVNSEVSTIQFAKGNLYIVGGYNDSTNYGSEKFNVYKWDGTSWTQLGTGSNAINIHGGSGNISSICIDANSNVYAATNYSYTNCYVSKWNGTTWQKLGSGFNSWINTVCLDATGNLYAGPGITSNGMWYIAKWDGTNWNQLGKGVGASYINTPVPLGFCTNSLSTMCIDPHGNVYANASVLVSTSNSTRPFLFDYVATYP